ncbi:hypothetical protein J4417_00035 [Candidatus Woesearchaeota archaeon]|nr:hypothetical protein [Candidatus Woesearchaeota archaeon]
MVAVAQSLALDERVEKLKAQYFSEKEEKNLDEKGKSHLYSLLDDLGYEETEGLFVRKRDSSIDIFMEKNLDKREEGFSYLCLTSPIDVLKFQEGYSKFLERERPNFGNGIGGGIVGGIVLGLGNMIPATETYEEISEALTGNHNALNTLIQGNFMPETSFWLAVSLPIVIGGIIEYVNSQNWTKSHEKNDKEFRERYLVADKKYATGKNAVALALSNS